MVKNVKAITKLTYISRKSQGTTGPSADILGMTESNQSQRRLRSPPALTNEPAPSAILTASAAPSLRSRQPFQALREQFEEYRPGTLIGGGKSAIGGALQLGLVR